MDLHAFIQGKVMGAGKFIVRLFAVIGGITVAVTLILIGVVLYAARSRPHVAQKTILEIDLEYGLREYTPESQFSRLLPEPRERNIRELVETLQWAATDNRIVGVIASIGSQPGSIAEIQEIRNAVAAFRGSGKSAIAFAQTMGEAQNGLIGYYCAAAFEKIFLQPSGDVGITGLISESPFFKNTLAKLGVQPQLEARYEYKTAKNIFTENAYTPEHRKAVQAVVSGALTQIVQGIAEDRRISSQRVRELIKQGPLSAAGALKEKLIDSTLYKGDAYAFIRNLAGTRSTFIRAERYHRSIAPKMGRGKTIALIYGVGTIIRGESSSDPLTGEIIMGSQTVTEAFRDAAKDKNVSAIIFRINSPGGSYVASDAIWHETVQAQKAGKPVIVSMGAVAGSGGYFVALSADRIVAHPATITGSIGVFGGKLVARDLLNRLGITFDAVVTDSNATYWSGLHRYTPQQLKQLNEMLDRIYMDFITKVARDRRISLDSVKWIARGRIWTGADAERLGLVDTLGGFPLAINLAKQRAGIAPDEPVQLKIYPKSKGILHQLFAWDIESEPRAAYTVYLRGAYLLNALQQLFKTCIHPDVTL